MPPPPEFAFDGQYAFLTYPRSGELSRERLRDMATERWNVGRFLIVRESHEDGDPHLHALLYWEKRRRLAGADCFDVDGHHPNIQRPKDIRAVYTYLRKEDGDPLESIVPICNVERLSGWGSILSESTSADDFLARVKGRYPCDYVLRHDAVVSFANKHYQPKPEPYVGRRRDEFHELPVMTDWVSTYLGEVLEL